MHGGSIRRRPWVRPALQSRTCADWLAHGLSLAGKGGNLPRRLLRVQRLEGLNLLARGVAHELNNLLMGILCNLQMVLWDLPTGHANRPGLAAAVSAARQAVEQVRYLQDNAVRNHAEEAEREDGVLS